MFNSRLYEAIYMLLLLLASCAVASLSEGIKPFTTDGCSMFPDRSWKSDWCHCCVIHDLAYWRGGTLAEKNLADEQLRECVERTTGNQTLADFMFKGVQLGGTPELNTSYRWGYGWPFGRGYKAPLRQQKWFGSQLAAW